LDNAEFDLERLLDIFGKYTPLKEIGMDVSRNPEVIQHVEPVWFKSHTGATRKGHSRSNREIAVNNHVFKRLYTYIKSVVNEGWAIITPTKDGKKFRLTFSNDSSLTSLKTELSSLNSFVYCFLRWSSNLYFVTYIPDNFTISMETSILLVLIELLDDKDIQIKITNVSDITEVSKKYEDR